MFSTVPCVGENFTCSQIFVGQKSHCSKEIGEIIESIGYQAVEIIIAEVGASHHE